MRSGSAGVLQSEFDALVLCVGATDERDLDVPGRDLDGIHYAWDYLWADNRRVAGRDDAPRPRIDALLELLFQRVPAGVGVKSSLRLSRADLDAVLENGSRWALERGFAVEHDVEHTEEEGFFANADPLVISDRAKGRGLNQLGTLGDMVIELVEDLD